MWVKRAGIQFGMEDPECVERAQTAKAAKIHDGLAGPTHHATGFHQLVEQFIADWPDLRFGYSHCDPQITGCHVCPREIRSGSKLPATLDDLLQSAAD